MYTDVVMAAGDLASAVTNATDGLKAEYLLVAPAAIVVGLVPFGVRRLWAFGKSLIK